METIDQLRHLGTFRMKPPYPFVTHEDDPLAMEYIKLEPSVLTIASSAMAGQRANHVFLSEQHAAVVTKRNAAIAELSKTINIDSWGRTALFPYETMRSAPNTRVRKDGVYIRVTYIYAYCIARIQYSTRLVPRPASQPRAPLSKQTLPRMGCANVRYFIEFAMNLI